MYSERQKAESLIVSYYWNLTNCQILDQGCYILSHLIFTVASLSTSTPSTWTSLWLILIQDRLFFRTIFCPSCNYIHASDTPWILPISCLLHLVAATSVVGKIQLKKNWGERRIRLLYPSQDIRAQGDELELCCRNWKLFADVAIAFPQARVLFPQPSLTWLTLDCP